MNNADNEGFTTEEIIIKNIILAKDYDVAYNYVQILKDQLRRDAVEEFRNESYTNISTLIKKELAKEVINDLKFMLAFNDAMHKKAKDNLLNELIIKLEAIK